ncbi:hypothetical protein HCG68_18485 [Paeniclostridium sordellii]|nr:hypothetical protein [Paeniclostridium sordellii]
MSECLASSVQTIPSNSNTLTSNTVLFLALLRSDASQLEIIVIDHFLYLLQ